MGQYISDMTILCNVCVEKYEYGNVKNFKGFLGIENISKERSHSFTASIIVFNAVFVKL
jgi:hypothetical protein